MGQKPFFTIVVPCLKEEGLLMDTLVSLSGQAFTNFEVILIDSGTSDTVLKKAKDLFLGRLRIYTVLYYHYYNMLNKGVKLALGEYVLFFRPGNVLSSIYAFEELHKMIKLTDKPHGVVSAGIAYNPDLEAKVIISPPLSSRKLAAGVIQTPLASRCFRRDFLLEEGRFDERYWVRAGFDLICRAALKPHIRIVSMSRVLTQHHTAFEIDGRYIGYHMETLKIIYRHFGFRKVISYLLSINMLSIFRYGVQHTGFFKEDQRLTAEV